MFRVTQLAKGQMKIRSLCSGFPSGFLYLGPLRCEFENVGLLPQVKSCVIQYQFHLQSFFTCSIITVGEVGKEQSLGRGTCSGACFLTCRRQLGPLVCWSQLMLTHKKKVTFLEML